ncbi:enoyl-CoA hydratase/isomerase family protein [Parasphingopyxis marina]|uniref:Enoyl-CoA hydratase/isomerase family protein n=1 Tax=Parasphingopyxis marina TaxID=2761622 RepID=A0A842I3F6_9SPHN|nr:enoyl-CoA hydratase-related protein [Parasphingopyxis marina]MBC2778930.1 enoyl-CoA hydratase/isomerase family protein [Parasphingopyxis marina]
MATLQETPVRCAPASLEIDGAVASITLDRAETLNTIDIEMARCLAVLGSQVERNEDIKVLVIRGAGRAFCSGGDIGLFASNLDALAAPIRELLTELHRFLCCLRRMPKLVITSVQGAAAGAGFSLSFMGDMCVASQSARFRPSYAQLGVSPDGGGTIGLVETVGARRALQIFLAEEELSADQAFAFGLVTHVVPEAAIADRTMALARKLAGNGSEVIAATKSLIYQSTRTSVSEQLEAELNRLLICMDTENFRAGVRNFIGKRR